MTSRPRLSSNARRPSSAIFVGTPLNIPALPDPPSPQSSVHSTGLPSPPATNSTGSGSTGAISNNGGSIRQRPSSFSPNKTNINTNTIMHNGSYEKTFHANFNNRARSIDDEEDEYENDEDRTFRLMNDRVQSPTSGSENAEALHRVQSLTQRNRRTIEKLSSISRSSSPAPRTPIRLPGSSSATSTASSSSSRLSSHTRNTSAYSSSQSTPASHIRRTSMATALSGSETEREELGITEHPSYSSDDLSITPPSTYSSLSNQRSPYTVNRALPLSQSVSLSRQRHISAPVSPPKAAREADRIDRERTARAMSPEQRTPRKMVSMVVSPASDKDDEEDGNDVMSAALAAVASSRRGSAGIGGSIGRKRQPLPKEFRDNEKASPSLDTRYQESLRDGTLFEGRGSPSPRSAASSLYDTNDSSESPHSGQQYLSPRAHPANRVSSIRESARHSTSRWASEDLSASTSSTATAREESSSGHRNGKDGTGRRLSLRGGAAEALGARTLVGQGLRAAGIMTRSDSENSVGATDEGSYEFDRRASERKEREDAAERERITKRDIERERSLSRLSRRELRVSPGDALSSSTSSRRLGSRLDSPMDSPSERASNRVGNLGQGHMRSSTLSGHTRTATSTLASQYKDEDPRTSPVNTRGFPGGSSSHVNGVVDRERMGAGSRQALSHLSHLNTAQERSYSPFGTRRHTSMTPVMPSPGSSAQHHLAQAAQSEHGRLMLESLSMFEGHLARLPPLGNTTNMTIPEVTRAAQNLVLISERLNGNLKLGNARALQEQIDAEVGGSLDGEGGEGVAEVWRRIGADCRESVRVSDELVRTVTGFLLGLGRVLKEVTVTTTAMSSASSDSGKPMDIGELRRVGSPDALSDREREHEMDARRSMDGRLSRESRRSWELAPILERSVEVKSRPVSALNLLREDKRRSASKLDAEREREQERESDEPPRAPSRTRNLLASTSRRLMSPREKREELSGKPPSSDSLESILALADSEPSPTPASRTNVNLNASRARALPALEIPAPLPNLPSESISRQASTSDKASHRRVSAAPMSTTRSNPKPLLSALSSPNATTALTPHTVSNTPGGPTPFPLLRGDSSKSSRANVTFSRPPTMSALNGLQQQHSREQRNRAISVTLSDNMMDEPSTRSFASTRGPGAGYDSERDAKRTVRRSARVSLDSSGTLQANRGSTLAPLVRERKKTIAEVFANA